jgi:cellulose synthase/poly-beta-1,6-N-acetylglucosamine synthase-like glycosyltransferase
MGVGMIGGRLGRFALASVAVAIAAPGALAVAHLTTLTAASLLPRRRRSGDGRRRRLLVMVAARDEEAVIARAVAPLVSQQRPGDIVMVVADRCRDCTAALAAAAGAEVLERPPDAAPGKGAAINDGLQAMAYRDWDALVTVDADSVVGDGFLAACDAALQTGAAAVQSRSEALPGEGVMTHAAVVAAALQGVSLPRGRDRLGVGVRLKGPGMVVRRDVVERHPFPSDGSSEDTRYGIDLVLAGVVPVHCDEAEVRSQSSRRLASASGQRLRWEAGRVHLARCYVAPLLRAGTPSSLEAAVHLATPPLAVAIGLLGAGAALAALAGVRPLVVLDGVLVGLVGLDVIVALVAAGADRRAWAALALAPAYIVWKGVLQARAVLGPDLAARPFEPTVRN